jgi:hypothetical protein
MFVLLLILFQTQALLAQTPDLIPYHDGKLWGYCNEQKASIILPQYRFASPFMNKRAWVQNKDNKWGMIDKDNKVIAPFVFREWQVVADSFYLVCIYFHSDSTKGYNVLNSEGKELWAWKYTAIQYKNEGMFSVEKHLIEGKATAKAPPNKKFWVDLEGNEYLFPSNCGSFSEGLVVCQGNYYDQTGKLAIKTGAYYAYPFKEKMAVIRPNKQQEVVINRKGEVVSKKIYEPLYNDRLFSEGLLPIKYKNLYGFINTAGEEVLPPIYDEAKKFSEGLAPVRMGELWGVINKQGRLVVPFLYDNIHNFEHGQAIIESKRSFGMIDQTGKQIVKPQYDDISQYAEGLAKVEFENHIGFVNSTGELKIPMQYAAFAKPAKDLAFAGRLQQQFKQGLFYLQGYGYINTEGKMFFDPAHVAPLNVQDLDKYNSWQLSTGISLTAYRKKLLETSYYTPQIQFADLDADQIPEIIIRTYTGGTHCCYHTEILAKNKADNLFYSIAKTALDMEIAPKPDANGRRRLVVSYYEELAYYHTCYACLTGDAVSVYDLYLDNGKLLAAPTNPERNQEIVQYLTELSKIPLQLLTSYDEPFLELATIMKQMENNLPFTNTDDGQRKAYLYNCLAYYTNNQRDLQKTKALFEKYYTFLPDKQIIWAEIQKILQSYSLVK